MTEKSLVVRKNANLARYSSDRDAEKPVSFLSEQEIYKLADAARGDLIIGGERFKTKRDGERNELLIITMFQCALRVSEATGVHVKDKFQVEDTYVLGIMGKGHKPRLVACPESLYMRLGNYASEHGLKPDDRFFPISRVRAWQIVKVAAKKAGIERRVYNHLLRHTGAVMRLKRTGNPKSLQMFLGHSDMKMTMRYLKTTQMLTSLEVEGKVNFDR